MLSCDKIIKAKNKLFDVCLTEFFYSKVEGDIFKDLVKVIAKQLKLPVELIQESLYDVVGLTLDLPTLTELTWRLCGNLHKLKEGKIVRKWVKQEYPEWVTVQVMYACLQERNSRKGVNLKYNALIGSPAGVSFFRWWSYEKAFVIARRIGFTKARGKRPYRHYSEFGRLRFNIYLEPTTGRYSPEQVTCSSGLLNWNKQILDYRNRNIDEKIWKCPQNSDIFCYNCLMGYDKCPAGVRPASLTIALR